MPTTTFPLTDILLVREVTSSELGLHYERELLRETQVGEREERLSQTLRVYDHKSEALAAKSVLERARARLRKVCARSVLGLVCPTTREAELEAAAAEIATLIAEARGYFGVYLDLPGHARLDDAVARKLPTGIADAALEKIRELKTKPGRQEALQRALIEVLHIDDSDVVD